jgi:hypothetical protein
VKKKKIVWFVPIVSVDKPTAHAQLNVNGAGIVESYCGLTWPPNTTMKVRKQIKKCTVCRDFVEGFR